MAKADNSRRGTYLVCIRSFECQDEDTGEIFSFTNGITYVDPELDAAREFPENFGPLDRPGEGIRDSVPIPDIELRSASPPAPDVTGLLVCIKGFEFQDPDTGLPRFARYGHDYVTKDDWLAEHYPENFVRVEDVVPSDGIPHLPLR